MDFIGSLNHNKKNPRITNDITFNYKFNIYKINFIWTIFIVQVNHSTLHPGFKTQYKDQTCYESFEKKYPILVSILYENKTKCTSKMLQPWM
jgi:hypothetical protein